MKLEQAMQRIMAQQEEKIRGDAWETCKEVEKIAKAKMRELVYQGIYAYGENTSVYSRTQNFIDSITTKLTQGQGTYSIYLWFDSDLWTYTTGGNPVYNAHADWYGNPIEETMLVSILDDRADFVNQYIEWMQDYAIAEFTKRLKIKIGR